MLQNDALWNSRTLRQLEAHFKRWLLSCVKIVFLCENNKKLCWALKHQINLQVFAQRSDSVLNLQAQGHKCHPLLFWKLFFSSWVFAEDKIRAIQVVKPTKVVENRIHDKIFSLVFVRGIIGGSSSSSSYYHSCSYSYFIVYWFRNWILLNN